MELREQEYNRFHGLIMTNDDPSNITVRRIQSGEGARLKAIRLTALADMPEAFGETLAEARSLSNNEYAVRALAGAAGNDWMFLVAENVDNDWVGMVGGLGGPSSPRLRTGPPKRPHGKCISSSARQTKQRRLCIARWGFRRRARLHRWTGIPASSS